MSSPATGGGRRHDVLSVLRAAEAPLSIADIAEKLGVHPNTIRFHLGRLVTAGRVERVAVPPSGPGRPALMFRSRPGMDPSGPRNFRLLAGVLAQNLRTRPHPAESAAEAGRVWGRQLLDGRVDGVPSDEQAVDRLVGILDDLGFMPERAAHTPATAIGLRHCPFLELVDDQAAIVCPVHLGLMQGAMDAMQAPLTVERLEAFAEPDLCLAHLGRLPGQS